VARSRSAIHFARVGFRRAAIARDAQMPRRGAQEIAVDGENDVGVLELGLEFEARAIGQRDAAVDVCAPDRLPVQPAYLWIGSS
jgi:hypothetical protein